VKSSPDQWILITQNTSEIKDFTEEELELTHFEESEKLFDWQREIYNQLFEKDLSTGEPKIKKADTRQIVSIIDRDGKKGKSTFLKWLAFKYPTECLKIGYGSASQLRTAVVNNRPRKIYFIDLPRTPGKKDKMEDLISAVKEIKNGHIMSAMYGSGRSLLMPHPHIVIFSNQPLNYNFLSKDRWKVFEITDQLQLKSQ
jgi:hypothetical protein